GRPKLLAVDAGAWHANVAQTESFAAPRATTSVFSAAPQAHAMGGAIVLEHLLSGSPVHVANQFSPDEHFARARGHGVRLFAGTASYFRMLLRHGLLA